jgi:hypothetical protein
MVGQLSRTIGNISGVENVVEIKVFNKIGGEYSSAQVSQPYKDTLTKEIRQTDSVVFMKNNQIFQIRFPNKDIKIRVKNANSTSY